MTLASAYGIGSFSAKPNLDHEISILKGASAYLKSYEGDLTNAFLYTKLSLAAAKRNPNVKGISDLEKEIDKVEDDIKFSTNKLVYIPVLNNIAARTDDVIEYNKKEKKKAFSIWYIGTASLVFSGLAFYKLGLLKKEKK